MQEKMRGFFSGNRQSAPLGPPKGASGPGAGGSQTSTKEETLSALRQRQRDKHRQFHMQAMRAEKERELAQQEGDANKVNEAEAQRRAMAEEADAIATQVATLERIMEEVGITVDREEDAKSNTELLEESREMYENGLVEAEERIREGEYISTMVSPFMMPSDVYDEDEAMRDLDECAKQTGRA